MDASLIINKYILFFLSMSYTNITWKNNIYLDGCEFPYMVNFLLSETLLPNAICVLHLQSESLNMF